MKTSTGLDTAITLLFAILLLGTPCCDGVVVTNIRLVNPAAPANTREGRIEIQVDGDTTTWGSVCDDKFGEEDAIVACRMLGFTNGGSAVLTDEFGGTNNVFLLDDTDCRGDEDDLSECLSSQTSDCSHATDTEVGVRCNENVGPGVTPAPVPVTTAPPSGIISGNCEATNPTVRLFGKLDVDGMGYVEVQNPTTREWGFVCDDGWNENAAKVVCAQLCYPTNYEAKPGIPAEHRRVPNNPNIILDNVVCAGNEATLQDCPHAAWGAEDCLNTDAELAGVQCVSADTQPPPPPVPILECGRGLLVARFSRTQDPNLEEKHLQVFSDPSCASVTKDTDTTFVSISIPVDQCGTTIERNGTHIIYRNEVKYDYTSQEDFITRVNTYRISLTCSLPVQGNPVTQRVEPLTEAVTQQATGSFQVRMEIYQNDSFTAAVASTPVEIPLGEWLNMAIVMEDFDSRLKLVVTDCETTPSGDTSSTTKKILFANKCIEESTLSFYPINDFKFGFRFRPFKFVGFPLMYIHCTAIACLASSNTEECDRTCQNTKPADASGRRKRSALYHAEVNSPAIIIYDPHSPDEDFGKDEDVKTVFGNDDSPTAKPSTSTTRPTTPPTEESLSHPSPRTEDLNTEYDGFENSVKDNGNIGINLHSCITLMLASLVTHILVTIINVASILS